MAQIRVAVDGVKPLHLPVRREAARGEASLDRLNSRGFESGLHQGLKKLGKVTEGPLSPGHLQEGLPGATAQPGGVQEVHHDHAQPESGQNPGDVQRHQSQGSGDQQPGHPDAPGLLEHPGLALRPGQEGGGVRWQASHLPAPVAQLLAPIEHRGQLPYSLLAGDDLLGLSGAQQPLGEGGPTRWRVRRAEQLVQGCAANIGVEQVEITRDRLVPRTLGHSDGGELVPLPVQPQHGLAVDGKKLLPSVELCQHLVVLGDQDRKETHEYRAGAQQPIHHGVEVPQPRHHSDRGQQKTRQTQIGHEPRSAPELVPLQGEANLALLIERSDRIGLGGFNGHGSFVSGNVATVSRAPDKSHRAARRGSGSDQE